MSSRDGTAITSIPDHGFDVCPYTKATRLSLNHNAIATVGTRAFAKLPLLVSLSLYSNAITWMAPEVFGGLTLLAGLTGPTTAVYA